MNNRKVRFWIVGGVALLIIGLFVGGLGMSGRLPWQGGNLYKDPQGRFTMKIDPGWEQVKTEGSYTQFNVPNPPLSMYLLVLKAGTVDDAFSQAFEAVGFDPGLLGGDSVTTFGDWYAYQEDDSAGLTYGLAGQMAGDNAYVMIVKTRQPWQWCDAVVRVRVGRSFDRPWPAVGVTVCGAIVRWDGRREPDSRCGASVRTVTCGQHDGRRDEHACGSPCRRATLIVEHHQTDIWVVRTVGLAELYGHGRHGPHEQARQAQAESQYCYS